MAETYSAGIVTAYGAAKRGGYTGTYEEFCIEQAGFAEAAQQVRRDKESVEQTVDTFSEETVPEAVQSVTNEGTRQIGLVTDAGDDAVESVENAGTENVSSVNRAGSAKVEAVNNAGTTQVGNVNQAGATQVQAVEDKGEEVLESIPADYTALDQKVDLLNDIAVAETNNAGDWAQGYWAIVDGTAQNSDVWVRSTTYLPDDVVAINSDDAVKIFLVAYEDGTYIGTWINGEFTKTYNTQFISHHIDVADFKTKYPTYTFRISAVKVTPGVRITPLDASQHIAISRINAVRNSDLLSKTGISWTKGGVTGSGTIDSNYNGIVSEIIQNVKSYTLNDSIDSVVLFFKNEKYVGKINKNDQLDNVPSSWKYFAGEVDVQALIEEFNIDANGIRISIIPASGTTITLTNAQEYGDSVCYVNTSIFAYDYTLKSAASKLNRSFIKSINHRGYNFDTPENTLPAFAKSKLMGFDAIEADLRYTSDGVAVMLHDDSINRTARNADGSELSETVNIWSITYEQALTYDYGIWMGTQYAGTKIPTLDETLLLCKQLGLEIWLDIKPVLTDARVQEVIASIKATGMDDHVVFMSGNTAMLLNFSETFPRATLLTGISSYTQEGINDAIARVQELQNGDNLVLTSAQYSALSAANANILSNAGIQCIAWGGSRWIVTPPLHKCIYGVFTDMEDVGEKTKAYVYDTYLVADSWK